MLKKIRPEDVEIGMFIHKLEGSWFSHPFWRARFLLEDADRLEQIRGCDIPAVVIDIARGSDVIARGSDVIARGDDVAQPEPAPVAARVAPARRRSPAPLPPIAKPAGPAFDLRSVAPQSTRREFGHAARVADRAGKVIGKAFLEARLGKTIKAATVEPVVEDIFASIQRNPHAFNGLMRCLQNSQSLYIHSLAISALMISLGRQIGLPPAQLRKAGTAGLLLDIGLPRLPVDHHALNGDYRAVPEAIMHTHPQLGHDLLIASGSDPEVVRGVLEHHERFGGGGFPHGLKGDAISLFGRMAAIAVAYDECVNGAAGSPAADPAAAIAYLCAQQDAFDPALVDAFTQAMGIWPLGALVRLRTGRLALVIDQNPTDVGSPRVCAFHSAVTGKRIKPVIIDLARCYGEDAIEGPAAPDAIAGDELDRLRRRLMVAAS